MSHMYTVTVESSIAIMIIFDLALQRLFNGIYSVLRRLDGSNVFFSKRVTPAGRHPHVVFIRMWRMFEV